MNYITLWILENESLICGDCNEDIQPSELAFLWSYEENTITMGTAEVRCRKCFMKAQANEDIKLLEGVLGQ